jgi:hypothetical protein
MYFFNLFTIGIIAVWLAVLQSLQVAKRRLEPVRVSHKK